MGGALAIGRQAIFPAAPSDRRGGHLRPTAERFEFWGFVISEGPKVGASPEGAWEKVTKTVKTISDVRKPFEFLSESAWSRWVPCRAQERSPGHAVDVHGTVELP